MKNRPLAASLAVVLATTLLLVISACRSVEEAPRPAAPAPEGPPIAEPEPYLDEWAGSTWILRDDPSSGSRDFPGYRGFHLGGDGRLLLINLDGAVGDSWSADGSRLRLGLLEGVPSIPIEGFYLAYRPDEASGDVVRMRLVPEAMPQSEGLIFEKAVVNVDIIENHWIPKRLRGGETVMWPLNREIHLMLLPDAVGGTGLLGYGGENRFRGGVRLTEEFFIPGNIAITRRIGPASEFENLFVERIAKSTRYVQVEDDLFLYTETRPTAAFRVRLFD